MSHRLVGWLVCRRIVCVGGMVEIDWLVGWLFFGRMDGRTDGWVSWSLFNLVCVCVEQNTSTVFDRLQ